MAWQEQLKYLRKYYTVTELCKKVQTSPNIIIALERGEYKPSEYQIFKLEKVYKKFVKSNPTPNAWKKELRYLCSRNRKKDVATMLNCDYKLINNWLTDKHYPHKKTIQKIHNAYLNFKSQEGKEN